MSRDFTLPMPDASLITFVSVREVGRDDYRGQRTLVLEMLGGGVVRLPVSWWPMGGGQLWLALIEQGPDGAAVVVPREAVTA